MSIRLTKDHRERICRVLLKGRFDAEREALKKREGKLAEAIYKVAFSPSERRRMAALPDGWMPTVTHVKARVLGEDVCFYPEAALRVPYRKSGNYGNCCHLIVLDDPKCDLVIQIRQFLADRKAQKEAARTLEYEIEAVLGSISTLNQLLKTWPEIETQAREIVGEPKPTVTSLAPRLERINERLGLGKKEGEAA
jgi:hypothetical protein